MYMIPQYMYVYFVHVLMLIYICDVFCIYCSNKCVFSRHLGTVLLNHLRKNYIYTQIHQT